MRITCLFSFFLCVSMTVQAQQISRQEALARAKTFMAEKEFVASMPRARAVLQDNQPYYIVNGAENRDFIILSGDKRVVPVMGYSDRGSLSI